MYKIYNSIQILLFFSVIDFRKIYIFKKYVDNNFTVAPISYNNVILIGLMLQYSQTCISVRRHKLFVCTRMGLKPSKKSQFIFENLIEIEHLRKILIMGNLLIQYFIS